MFNPEKYTISKSNSYKDVPTNKNSEPEKEFKKAGSTSLELDLLFDTYESNENVAETTDKLWELMRPKAQANGENKLAPPVVVFEWGVFSFEAIIQSMKQTFTLFKKDGSPVRAEVHISFDRADDPSDQPNQNPTSGGGPIERIREVVRGDRLDLIAAEVYGDSTLWRMIAEHNGMTNPLALKPGQRLAIPPKSSRV
jgi:hypothetical protein